MKQRGNEGPKFKLQFSFRRLTARFECSSPCTRFLVANSRVERVMCTMAIV